MSTGKFPIVHFPLLAAVLILCGCDKIDAYSYANGKGYPLTGTQVQKPTGTLPLLSVTTDDGKTVSSRTSWKKATLNLADTASVIQIKGRGNSTWGYPKKPFAIKFDEPVSLLGMKPATRWCLLANYLDPTYMRNAVTFTMARGTSLEWTPDFRYVEVELNGVYLGLYLLTEKVEIAESRLDARWLVCLDDYYDENFRFRSAYKGLPVNIICPSGTTVDAVEFNAIRAKMDSVETALYVSKSGYEGLLDLPGFADWYLIQELSTNSEGKWPKSVYMYLGNDGKMHAGPAWDYDYSAYRADIRTLIVKGHIWYDALFSYPEFTATVKERWEILRPFFEETSAGFIRETMPQIDSAARTDWKMWPVSLHINGDEQMSFDDASARLAQTITQRLGRMDILIGEL